MLRIAHIVNPHSAARDDLRIAQPITFESMRIARRFVEEAVAVELLAAQFPGDPVPDGFRATRELDRSILDVGKFSSERRLPLLADILDRAYEETDADYLIYTNVDIAVMPHFYLGVAGLLGDETAAVSITRRTIPVYERIEDLPRMYSEVGEPHPGFDCFVFRRDLRPKLLLGELCVGAMFFARVLKANLEVFGAMRTEHDLHLTFHLGDDRLWLEDDMAEYNAHNLRELDWIAAELGVEVSRPRSLKWGMRRDRHSRRKRKGAP